VRGLDAAFGRLDEFCDLLERIVKDVFEQHACAFFGRQTHYKLFNRSTNVKESGIRRHNAIRADSSDFGLNANTAPSQEVDAAVVCNAKEPWCEGSVVVILVQLPISLE
jgi:hypothetical protein